MELHLCARIALVTGASAGIGRAIALALASERARLVLVARRAHLLEELAAEAVQLGAPRPVVVEQDLRSPDAGQQILHAVATTTERVDIAVHNAGVGVAVSGAGSDSTWSDEFQLRFTAVRHLTEGLLPSMIERGWGRIILVGGSQEPERPQFTATDAGIGGLDSIVSSPTDAANSARMMWAKTLSRQVGQYGITVNTVVPGRILSEQIVERLYPTEADRERFAAANIPAGHFGQPEDAAFVVTMLASPRGGFISGEVIHVDGGQRRHAF